MMKRLVVLLAFLGLLFGGISIAAGTAKAAPIKNDQGLCLASPEETTIVKHAAEYITQSRWTRDVPEVKEISHQEYRFFHDVPDTAAVNKTLYKFYRDVPAVDETTSQWYRWKKIIPGSEGVRECKYQKTVTDQKTQYHFAKYTQTRSKTWVPAVSEPDLWWNLSPNNSQGPQDYTPAFPNDSRGTWQGPHSGGGPNQDTYGTFQTGGGNSPFFHREHGTTTPGHWGEWTDYGPWTKWSPETHTSWEDSTDPLGTPQPHASWQDGNTYYERVWQARWDGQTRQVDAGSHVEYEWFTKDPGAPWTKTDECRWKIEPVPDTVEWYPSEDGWTKDVKGDPWIKVAEETRGNGDGVPGYREYKTTDGTTLVEANASEFEQSEFPGWTILSQRTEEVSAAIPGWREYKTADGSTKNVDDAAWFLEKAFEGWSQFGDPKKVVTQEFVPGYHEYYVHAGNPTRELGESNWTTDAPEGWTLVDTRQTLTKEAWTEKVVTPAKWEKCTDTLAYTGVDDSTWLFFGLGGLLVLGGSGAIFLGRKNG